MKFGICTSIDNLEKALNAGADYIEVGNTALCKLSDGDFEKAAAIADSFPGKILACNGLFPGDIRLTGENQSDKIVPWLEKSVSRLARVGVKNIVFGSGSARNCPEGFPMEKAFEQIVQIARITADLSKPHGMTIVIEPLRAEETNIIHTAADSCNVAKQGARDNIRGHVDFYHFMQGGEKLRDLIPCIPLLGHVHIASPVKRSMPTFDDCADYKAFLSALRSGGYDGLVSFEGKKPDSWELIAEYFSFIKSL